MENKPSDEVDLELGMDRIGQFAIEWRRRAEAAESALKAANEKIVSLEKHIEALDRNS